MTRRTTALAAALSLLPLGQPLLLGSTTALATAAVVLSPQAAHAQSADEFFNRGNVKGDLGDYQGAIADYTKAIEINPQDAAAYNNRCWNRYLSSQYKRALPDCDKALSIDPRSAEAFDTRGDVRSALGDNKGACSDYKKAISYGYQPRGEWLNSEEGAWCRNMR